MSSRSPLRTAAASAIIAILALVVLAADQFSKHLALTHLEPGVSNPVVGEALQFVLVFNPGAAFSLGEEVTWVFTIAMALVAAVIVFLAATRVRSRLWAIVLGLLLGGVLGNLGDRLFRDPGFAVGHVVDFILTPWMWFWTPTPAIFNVADIFIVGGMATVALLLVIGVELDGTRAHKRAAGAGTGAEDAETTDPVETTVSSDDEAATSPDDPAEARTGDAEGTAAEERD
ncbi:MAG: signal peptidase II [Microbacterium sp.]